MSFAKQSGLIVLTSHAESSVESVTADMADIKVSEPTPSHSKPVPDTSTSVGAASAHKHDDIEEEETETAEDRAKREAELSKIYADLAKEDDRCWLVDCHHCCSSCACFPVAISCHARQLHMQHDARRLLLLNTFTPLDIHPVKDAHCGAAGCADMGTLST